MAINLKQYTDTQTVAPTRMPLDTAPRGDMVNAGFNSAASYLEGKEKLDYTLETVKYQTEHEKRVQTIRDKSDAEGLDYETTAKAIQDSTLELNKQFEKTIPPQHKDDFTYYTTSIQEKAKQTLIPVIAQRQENRYKIATSTALEQTLSLSDPVVAESQATSIYNSPMYSENERITGLETWRTARQNIDIKKTLATQATNPDALDKLEAELTSPATVVKGVDGKPDTVAQRKYPNVSQEDRDKYLVLIQQARKTNATMSSNDLAITISTNILNNEENLPELLRQRDLLNDNKQYLPLQDDDRLRVKKEIDVKIDNLEARQRAESDRKLQRAKDAMADLEKEAYSGIAIKQETLTRAKLEAAGTPLEAKIPTLVATSTHLIDMGRTSPEQQAALESTQKANIQNGTIVVDDPTKFLSAISKVRSDTESTLKTEPVILYVRHTGASQAITNSLPSVANITQGVALTRDQSNLISNMVAARELKTKDGKSKPLAMMRLNPFNTAQQTEIKKVYDESPANKRTGMLLNLNLLAGKSTEALREMLTIVDKDKVDLNMAIISKARYGARSLRYTTDPTSSTGAIGYTGKNLGDLMAKGQHILDTGQGANIVPQEGSFLAASTYLLSDGGLPDLNSKSKMKGIYDQIRAVYVGISAEDTKNLTKESGRAADDKDIYKRGAQTGVVFNEVQDLGIRTEDDVGKWSHNLHNLNLATMNVLGLRKINISDVDFESQGSLFVSVDINNKDAVAQITEQIGNIAALEGVKKSEIKDNYVIRMVNIKTNDYELVHKTSGKILATKIKLK